MTKTVVIFITGAGMGFIAFETWKEPGLLMFMLCAIQFGLLIKAATQQEPPNA